MMNLRVEPDLFVALRAGFEAGATGDTPPINTHSPVGCGRLWQAPSRRLCRARPVGDLFALGDCFAVGGEGHPPVTELQWDAINELVDQAANSG